MCFDKYRCYDKSERYSINSVYISIFACTLIFFILLIGIPCVSFGELLSIYLYSFFFLFLLVLLAGH